MAPVLLLCGLGKVPYPLRVSVSHTPVPSSIYRLWKMADLNQVCLTPSEGYGFLIIRVDSQLKV